MKNKKTEFVCVNCKETITTRPKGSMKHPYCEKCFEKVWNNNNSKYFAFLERRHTVLFYS